MWPPAPPGTRNPECYVQHYRCAGGGQEGAHNTDRHNRGAATRNRDQPMCIPPSNSTNTSATVTIRSTICSGGGPRTRPAAVRDAGRRCHHRRLEVHRRPRRPRSVPGCKGCRSDCPVKVDMATYKAEFMLHTRDGCGRCPTTPWDGCRCWRASPQPGGGAFTQQLELGGVPLHHDLCPAVQPMAVASPFFQRFGLTFRQRYGRGCLTDRMSVRCVVRAITRSVHASGRRQQMMTRPGRAVVG